MGFETGTFSVAPVCFDPNICCEPRLAAAPNMLLAGLASPEAAIEEWYMWHTISKIYSSLSQSTLTRENHISPPTKRVRTNIESPSYVNPYFVRNSKNVYKPKKERTYLLPRRWSHPQRDSRCLIRTSRVMSRPAFGLFGLSCTARARLWDFGGFSTLRTFEETALFLF